FFFTSHGTYRDLHSFPTRRSSDLDCPNVKALRRNPERFTAVSWDGESAATSSFRVTIALQSWDRPRLLEDVARTFAELGCNIVEDRKSTRLNSSHLVISYAVFCLK